jgi:hypothetical protein
MPEKETLKRAAEDRREGKSPSTQAGEFVHEEIEHIREGKHGARSAKQAIAIGLSKARRAGVRLPPPPGGKASTRKKAAQDTARSRRAPSAARSRAAKNKLKKESRQAASPTALSRQARQSARTRGPAKRRAAAQRAAATRKK